MERLPRYLSNTIEVLPEKFHQEDFLDSGRRSRKRVFGPKAFLLTMFQLVGSVGKEGYDHALVKVFGMDQAPRKSSLSNLRSKISYKFLEKILSNTLDKFGPHRPTYNGMIIYAVDGWQITLPRSKNIVDQGYTGRKTSKYKESYMPKGFITHAYEVLSETTKNIAVNNSPTELADALAFVENLEKNSITLYDRAYFSRSLCLYHMNCQSFFIARCRSNSNQQIKDFFEDISSDEGSMYYDTEHGKKKIWFIKIYNSHTKETLVFATNLSREWRNKKTFEQLYQLRWGAETSFYELSETIKVQQWHSKSLNGVLQELYTALLIINLTKILSYFARGQKTINPEKAYYKKPNFKLLMNCFLKFLLESKPQLSHLIHKFMALIKRSTETRKRRSRTYPRVIMSPASPYPHRGSEWFWEKGFGLK